MKITNICYSCGVTESKRINYKNGKITDSWLHNHDEDKNVLCRKCYDRLKHNRGIIIKSEKKCVWCNSTKTYRQKNGYEFWYFIDEEGNRFCRRCYDELIHNEIKTKYMRINYNPRRYSYRNLRIHTFIKPRTGFCSWCFRNIYDRTCRRTSLHHEFGYFPIFMWFGIVELCNRCHLRTHS